MILGARQQQELSRELQRLAAYGQTEVEFHEWDSRRRGHVVIKQWAWDHGWKLRESVRIGGGGKVTPTAHRDGAVVG